MSIWNPVYVLAVGGATLLATACAADGAPATAPRPCSLAPSTVCVDGTVHYFGIEGGFWAVLGANRVVYDPLGGLPTAFQYEGLRVYLEARVRPDMASFHMVGPIVEILTLERE